MTLHPTIAKPIARSNNANAGYEMAFKQGFTTT
jgi:hypothetical protein